MLKRASPRLMPVSYTSLAIREEKRQLDLSLAMLSTYLGPTLQYSTVQYGKASSAGSSSRAGYNYIILRSRHSSTPHHISREPRAVPLLAGCWLLRLFLFLG